MEVQETPPCPCEQRQLVAGPKSRSRRAVDDTALQYRTEPLRDDEGNEGAERRVRRSSSQPVLATSPSATASRSAGACVLL
eukprot:m51a1_g8625 hypothetical protein (81) ;mRNA; r:95899-96141